MVEDVGERSPTTAHVEYWLQALSGSTPVLEQIPLSIVAVDPDGRIISCNEAARQLVGYPAEDLVGSALALIDVEAAAAGDVRSLLAARVGGPRAVTYRRRDGRQVTLHQFTAPLPGGPDAAAYVAIACEVPAGPDGAEQAAPDLGRLADAIATAGRDGTEVAVLAVGIDQLDRVEQALGTEARADLVARTEVRLRDWVRSTDAVVRVDDGFVVLLASLRRATSISVRVDALIEDLHSTVMIGGRAISLTVSIGGAVYPGDGQDPAALLAAADLAKARARDEGGNFLVWRHEIEEDL